MVDASRIVRWVSDKDALVHKLYIGTVVKQSLKFFAASFRKVMKNDYHQILFTLHQAHHLFVTMSFGYQGQFNDFFHILFDTHMVHILIIIILNARNIGIHYALLIRSP